MKLYCILLVSAGHARNGGVLTYPDGAACSAEKDASVAPDLGGHTGAELKRDQWGCAASPSAIPGSTADNQGPAGPNSGRG